MIGPASKTVFSFSIAALHRVLQTKRELLCTLDPAVHVGLSILHDFKTPTLYDLVRFFSIVRRSFLDFEASKIFRFCMESQKWNV